jgi:hypothetical protein
MATTQTGRITVTAADRRDDDVASKPAGAAPAFAIAPIARQPVLQSMARHDAFFVAQLIAMAQHGPQMRILRHAAPRIAHAAYHSASEHIQGNAQTGLRVMRVI